MLICKISVKLFHGMQVIDFIPGSVILDVIGFVSYCYKNALLYCYGDHCRKLYI